MGALPGIEYRKTEASSNKIALRENPVAGFVGITQKGPLNEAVRITGFNEFLSRFGISTPPVFCLSAFSPFFRTEESSATWCA